MSDEPEQVTFPRRSLTYLFTILLAMNPGDQAEYDPGDNRHVTPFPPMPLLRQRAPALSSVTAELDLRDASRFLRHGPRKPPYPARTYRRRALSCRNPYDRCNGRSLSSNWPTPPYHPDSEPWLGSQTRTGWRPSGSRP